MYKCCNIDNPFKTRKDEVITSLDWYVKVLNKNNIPFTNE